MAALAMRLNQLGILPDWSYRGICIELSKYGRTREPNGILERETSAVLDKLFTLLKESGTSFWPFGPFGIDGSLTRRQCAPT